MLPHEFPQLLIDMILICMNLFWVVGMPLVWNLLIREHRNGKKAFVA